MIARHGSILALLLTLSSALAGPFGGGPFGGGGGSPPASTTNRGTVQLGVDVEAYVYLAADQTESAATLTDATGLAFTPAANATYYVEFYGIFNTTAVGNGFQWKFVEPTGLNIAGGVLHSANSGTGEVFRVGPLTANGALGLAAGTTANEAAYGWALFEAGASPVGTFKVQFNSELAAGNSVTLQAGSFLRYRRIL